MENLSMGLKEAVDIADAALASGSPRINVVKAIREAYRTGASDGMKAAFGQNDETALETLNDENADLRARLANAETRIDSLIETLAALATND